MNTEIRERIEKELAKHTGLNFAFQRRGKHPCVVLSHAGQSRFVVFTSTPTDRRGILNCISDVRKALRHIGVIK